MTPGRMYKEVRRAALHSCRGWGHSFDSGGGPSGHFHEHRTGKQYARMVSKKATKAAHVRTVHRPRRFPAGTGERDRGRAASAKCRRCSTTTATCDFRSHAAANPFRGSSPLGGLTGHG